MAILEAIIYDEIIVIGKKSVESIKKGDLNNFIKFSELAWNKFPEPKENWNQTYNFCKMVFKHLINSSLLCQAEEWLNRMVLNNNKLHLFDVDIDFNIGKLHFEMKDYTRALEKWNYVVKEAGYRYFERENSKYKDFYLNPEKYTNE